MVWDKESDTVFWDMIQDPEIPANNLTGKRAGFIVPKENVLDSNGLKRISVKTRNRYRRFQDEQNGANILIERLSEALDAEIDYNAQNGILYVHPRGQQPQVTFFGKAAERVQALSEGIGLPAELTIEKAIKRMAEIESHMDDGHHLIFKKSDGSEIVYTTSEELYRAAKRNEELNEE